MTKSSRVVVGGIVLCCIAVQYALAAVQPITVRELYHRLAQGGDTVFVVNFWATWCRPCVAELPYFDKLERRYRDSTAMRVLLVSVDDIKDREKVSKYLASKSFAAQSYIMDDGNPSQWIDAVDSTWSGAIPATLFVRGNLSIRTFHETEFTFESLKNTFVAFRKDEP